MAKPLVLSDSHGKYFHQHFADLVDVKFQSGAKIEELWNLFSDSIHGRKVRDRSLIMAWGGTGFRGGGQGALAPAPQDITPTSGTILGSGHYATNNNRHS